MSATMRTITVAFTVSDNSRLPDGWDDALHVELQRIATTHPILFAVLPEV